MERHKIIKVLGPYGEFQGKVSIEFCTQATYGSARIAYMKERRITCDGDYDLIHQVTGTVDYSHSVMCAYTTMNKEDTYEKLAQAEQIVRSVLTKMAFTKPTNEDELELHNLGYR